MSYLFQIRWSWITRKKRIHFSNFVFWKNASKTIKRDQICGHFIGVLQIFLRINDFKNPYLLNWMKDFSFVSFWFLSKSIFLHKNAFRNRQGSLQISPFLFFWKRCFWKNLSLRCIIAKGHAVKRLQGQKPQVIRTECQRLHVKKPHIPRPLISKAPNKFSVSIVKSRLMWYAACNRSVYTTTIFLVWNKYIQQDLMGHW